MKESLNGLLELSQSRCRCDDASSEPKGDAKTKAPAIGNRNELFNLIDKPPATFAIAVEGMMDLLDISAH
jgi:hypothetical protein